VSRVEQNKMSKQNICIKLCDLLSKRNISMCDRQSCKQFPS
jgi:hypothetical protein